MWLDGRPFFGRILTFYPPKDSDELRRIEEQAISVIRQAAMAGIAVVIESRLQTMSTVEAAKHLGISRPTLIKLLDRGEIPYEWNGGNRSVQLADLERYRRRRGRLPAASISRARSLLEEELRRDAHAFDDPFS